jgi:hypothetical protein
MSMMTLIEMATTEGWAEVMEHGVAAVGLELQPIPDSKMGF